MKCILGTKLNMTQVFKEDGTVVPVTCVKAGPCVITQVKTNKKDGANAVQLGFGEQKIFRLNKSQQGHLKGLSKDNRTAVRFLRDVRIEEDHALKRGDVFTVKIFIPGEKVAVIGTAKGKGFQGVVKRHGFHGSPASHGHKDQLRMPGSIGATDAARVFKGMRMGGHMGDNQVTVKNLEIVEINPEKNELFIKGAVPGARGGLLIICNEEGKMEMPEEKPEAGSEKPEVEEKTPVEESKEQDIKEDLEKRAEVAEEEKKEKSKEKAEKEEEPKEEDKK